MIFVFCSEWTAGTDTPRAPHPHYYYMRAAAVPRGAAPISCLHARYIKGFIIKSLDRKKHWIGPLCGAGYH